MHEALISVTLREWPTHLTWPVVAATLGAGFLYVSFRLIESQWPESYVSVADVSAYRKMSRPATYILFRFGPPFAVALFGAVNLGREKESVWLFATLLAGLHVAQTSGVSGIQVARSSSLDQRRWPLLVMHLLVSGAIVTTIFGATGARHRLAAVVPELEQVLPEMWGAVAAAVLAAWFISNTTHRGVLGTQDLIAAQRRKIGSGLLNFARSEAVDSGTSPDLLEAILITESVQRPKWFRKLERIKGIVVKPGTYGIMQVHADAPIDDRTSIRKAVHDSLAGAQVPLDGGYPNAEELKKLFMGYNPSTAFAEMASEILNELFWESRD